MAQVMAWMMLVVGTGIVQGETGRAGGRLGKGVGEGRWDGARDLCMSVCVYVGKKEPLISRLLRGLSHFVPVAQLAPALTMHNPWDKARKTGWCSECVYSRCQTIIRENGGCLQI